MFTQPVVHCFLSLATTKDLKRMLRLRKKVTLPKFRLCPHCDYPYGTHRKPIDRLGLIQQTWTDCLLERIKFWCKRTCHHTVCGAAFCEHNTREFSLKRCGIRYKLELLKELAVYHWEYLEDELERRY